MSFPYYLYFDTTPTYIWKKYNVTETKVDVAGASEYFTPASEYITGSYVKASNTQPTISGDTFSALSSPFNQTTSEAYDGASRYTYFSTSAGTTGTLYYEYWWYDGYTSGDIIGKRHTLSTSQTKGAYIEDVTSTDANAYPNDGIQNGYWYVKQS